MSFSKEIWGNCVWNLFHTIAHKIKEDRFTFHKNSLIFIVENICRTLPCPDCSRDAMEMLNRVNFSQINSKAEFKLNNNTVFIINPQENSKKNRVYEGFLTDNI